MANEVFDTLIPSIMKSEEVEGLLICAKEKGKTRMALAMQGNANDLAELIEQAMMQDESFTKVIMRAMVNRPDLVMQLAIKVTLNIMEEKPKEEVS